MQNTNIQQRGYFPALLQCTALLLLLGLNAQAAVKTWDGSSSGNWATAANWTGNVAPVDGDDLVFPSGAANLLNTNNLTALRLNSIIFTGSGYTLRGNALTVTNGISGQQAAGANAVECNLTLGAAQTFDCVNAGAGQTFSHITNSGFALTFSGSGNLTASGLISGAGGVTKNGAGTLTYSGLRNTYTGTTRVNRGTLALNCSPFNDAFRGPLIISDGTGPAEVRLLLAEEIPDATAVTVQAGGTLNLDSHNETIGELTLQGGTVSSGTATLTLGGDVTVLASSSTATINGNLAFTGGLRTIRVADGSVFYDLNLNANIRDAGGGLLFTNAAPVSNFVRLLGSNSFTGPLTVANIRLSAETPWALGATNNGTTVKTNATLWLYQTSITNEALTLEGGATWVSQLNCTWAGPVTFLGGTATLNPYPEANTLDIIGSITGAGGCTKIGAGKLRYSGATDNLYSGPTEVREGTLELNKSSYWWAIGHGSLTIGDGSGGANADVVRYVSAGTSQLNTSVPITINSSGLLDLNNHSDDVGPITMVAGAITTGTGVLTPGNITATAGTSTTATIAGRLQLSTTRTFEMLPGPLSPSLRISAAISGSGGLTKTGPSGLDLLASNSYSGLTVVSQGQLFVGDSYSLGATNSGTVVSNGAGLILSFDVNVGEESLSLAGAGVSDQGALWSANNTTASWAGPITFASDTVIGVVGPSGKLTLSGTLSGPGGFTKVAEGTLVIAGSTDNSYDGLTTVKAGQLHFNKTGYSNALKSYGPGLVVGEGAESATVRWLNNYQLWSVVTPVTVNRLGVLDLNGYDDTVAPLTLAGGQVVTGAGRVRLSGMLTVLTNAQTATISGNAYLIDPLVITNAGHFSSPDLRINASIGGGAGHGITKTGPGDVELMVSNSFSGPVTINNGELEIRDAWALGNTNTPVTVNSGGTLHLFGSLTMGEKPLVLNGPGWPGASFVGALAVSDGNSSWAGPITNASDSTVYVYSSRTMDLGGLITGPGGLTKTGGGTLIFSGSRANTYAGVTRLNAGTLLLNKSGTDGAIPGDLIIGDGTGGANADVLRLAANNQINNNANVTLNSSGLLDMDGRYDRFNALSGSGNIQFGAGGYVIPGDAGASSTFSGVASGAGYVWKVGNGVLTLSGNNSYTGQTRVQGGTLLVNGSQPQSNVRVETGATLGGSGTVGDILGEGIVAPGASPGCLTSSNLTFAATGNYRVELNGTTPCSGYDQMIVRGTNALANATLTVIPAFPPGQPAVGDQFVILNNDGADPITGTFAGLPNGATFNVGDIGFRINYNGGTGNDVVLTVQSVTVPSVPGTAVTLNSADRGWYNDIGYHDPDNQNYYVGDLDTGTNTLRNWFVFNVPVFTGTVAKAELLINCFSNLSPHPDETYVLRHVSTPIATLTAGGSGLTNIYKDLADGPVYAVRKVYMVETGQRAIIPLNVTFLNDVTAAKGSQIALGGALATLDDQPYDQQLFGWSGLEVNDVQLRLTFGTSTLVNASKTGWYDHLGSHNAANSNYFVGETGGKIYRNFFVFNLPAMSAPPAGAEVLAIPGRIFSPTNWVDYHLHEVTTPISTLTNNATGATGVFADLGDGLIYGGRPLYVSESNFTTRVSIPLNSSFAGAAFAHAGSPFALGGALTLGPGTNNEGAFAATSGDPGDVQLWLGFLPSSLPVATFAAGSPTPLDTNRFQFQLVGTIGTKQEIQASFDFENWDVVGTLLMTNTTSTFYYTNTVFPYRFFRARLLQ